MNQLRKNLYLSIQRKTKVESALSKMRISSGFLVMGIAQLEKAQSDMLTLDPGGETEIALCEVFGQINSASNRLTNLTIGFESVFLEEIEARIQDLMDKITNEKENANG